jgi:hypothetical protein
MALIKKPRIILVYDTVHSGSLLPAEGSPQDGRLFWNIGRHPKTKFCHNLSDYKINIDYISCVFVPKTIFVKKYINRIKISY